MEDLKKLIAINSISGPPAIHAPFGEANRRALDTFLSIAASYGLRTGRDGGYAGWAETGEGEKLIGVLGHLDVVPAGAGWTSDPFTLTVRNGNYYGRGISDDKGPLFACLRALKRISDEGRKTGARIRLIAGCNEESGSECIKHYVRHCEIPAVSFTPDSDFPVVASEKGILHLRVTFPNSRFAEEHFDEILSGERANIVPCEATCAVREGSPLLGALKQRIGTRGAKDVTLEGRTVTAHGKAAHGSLPERGDNAAVKLLKLLAEVCDDAAICWAAERLSPVCAAEKLGIACEDESGRLTVNLGVCELRKGFMRYTLDLRLPACADADDVIGKIRATLPEKAETEILHRSDALMFAEDDKLVETLMNVYRETTGDDASRPLHIGGGTYAKELPNCVAFGAVFPGMDTHMHEPDEFYPVEAFALLEEIYYRAMLALCKAFG